MLKNSADQLADKPNHLDFVKPKWEEPELYEPSAGLKSKDWFVWAVRLYDVAVRDSIWRSNGQ